MFEDAVDADVAVAGDVGVEDAREEADLWRVEGVIERHLQVEVEDAALVRAPHRARDERLPVVLRRVQGLPANTWRGVKCEGTKTEVRGHPDMMSASEGGGDHGKSGRVGREVA